jgi:hypothetical protein
MFFMGELLLFKTLSWKMALQPMIVAGAALRCKLSMSNVQQG